ncbi:MAG: hypothetical protein ACEPO2_20670 [Pelagibaca sp.]
MAEYAIITPVEFFMKRKSFKDVPAFPVLYPQYVFENRARNNMEKAKPQLDMDYVRALVILIAGILVLISI